MLLWKVGPFLSRLGNWWPRHECHRAKNSKKRWFFLRFFSCILSKICVYTLNVFSVIFGRICVKRQIVGQSSHNCRLEDGCLQLDLMGSCLYAE